MANHGTIAHGVALMNDDGVVVVVVPPRNYDDDDDVCRHRVDDDASLG